MSGPVLSFVFMAIGSVISFITGMASDEVNEEYRSKLRDMRSLSDSDVI